MGCRNESTSISSHCSSSVTELSVGIWTKQHFFQLWQHLQQKTKRDLHSASSYFTVMKFHDTTTETMREIQINTSIHGVNSFCFRVGILQLSCSLRLTPFSCLRVAFVAEWLCYGNTKIVVITVINSRQP